MIWHKYELESTVMKASEALTLWKTENGIVKIDKNTIAIPIKSGDERKGYVFHGNGKLLLDTIVETEKGAIGEPVEKELEEPFLVLGNAEEIQQRFITASEEDLKIMGYESEQKFFAKTEELFDRFLGRGLIHEYGCCGKTGGFIFAFPNSGGKLDILITKGSKLVYKAADKVFVSNKRKVVLKTPKEVIVSSDQKYMIFKR
ncbi:hypothetical protein HXY32_00435 [Candidatus Bathyarchaeota archaeon]|nr:hypothetical protein [Candidatus Bathyarchaeota archaeon]